MSSRLLTGTFLIILGIFLTYLSFSQVIWILIYAIPSLLIGFAIINNRNEDKIEKIKESDE